MKKLDVMKKLGMIWVLFISAVGRQRQEDLWGTLGEFQVSERTCHQKRWMAPEKPYLRSISVPHLHAYTCTHTCTHRNIHVHAYTYTHTKHGCEDWCDTLLKIVTRLWVAQTNNSQNSWKLFLHQDFFQREFFKSYILNVNGNKTNEVDVIFKCKNLILGLEFIRTAVWIALPLDYNPEDRDPCVVRHLCEWLRQIWPIFAPQHDVYLSTINEHKKV